MCRCVCLNARAYSPSLYHISRMEKPISRLMSPYLGETKKRLLQASPQRFSRTSPLLFRSSTCNLLIQDFVVFGVRELLQLQ